MTERPSLIGKKELAEALGWGRMRLDRRINSDPSFPIARRGDQSGGWAFEEVKVKTHLKRTGDWGGVAVLGNVTAKRQSPPPAVDNAQLRDVVRLADPLPARGPELPFRPSASRPGEATARQRIDEAKARKLEREEAEAAQLVVPVAEMRQKLAQLIVQLASDLDALPEEIARAGGLPEDTVPGFRTLIDRVRTEMHRSAKSIFADG